MRVILTGGATGGHITPFAPIVDALRSMHQRQQESIRWSLEPKKMDIRFWGIVDDRTRSFFAEIAIPTSSIPSGKLRRYFSFENIVDLTLRFPLGCILAAFKMWWSMPDVVISKGGYGSLPITLAAAFYRVPVLLHESDMAPGLANRIAARFAAAVAVSFDGAAATINVDKRKIVATGTPVRTAFGGIDQVAAKRHFGFPPTEQVLLVTGGSQGAHQINEIVIKLLPRLITEMGIIHVTGEKNFTPVSSVAQELLASTPRANMYKVYPYMGEMPEAMAAADVIVARAGSTTLAEIVRSRRPSLLIPLASAANDHQRKNAALFEREGAARVLDPANMKRSLFEQSIKRLMHDDSIRTHMIKRLAALDKPRASENIAELTLRLAQGLVPRKGAQPGNATQ